MLRSRLSAIVWMTFRKNQSSRWTALTGWRSRFQNWGNNSRQPRLPHRQPSIRCLRLSSANNGHSTRTMLPTNACLSLVLQMWRSHVRIALSTRVGKHWFHYDWAICWQKNQPKSVTLSSILRATVMPRWSSSVITTSNSATLTWSKCVLTGWRPRGRWPGISLWKKKEELIKAHPRYNGKPI